MCEEHERYLSEDYFPIVCQINRNPRYVNKRIMDPQLKCFVDEVEYEIPPEWGLPTPNPNAAYKSLAKYGKDLLPMSEDMVVAMNMAWSFTARHFGIYMKESVVLDYEAAKSHLDMNTSSGAPFNQHYKLKKDLFEKDETIDEWLQSDWDLMGTDPNWTCLFTNSLKEELRTTEKMCENSIRTFLAGGVDAVVHGTRLFVDMNEKMYASHLKSSSAVGMSPYKGNWDQLFRKLKAFRKGYALDESQYDSSLRSYMMWGCAKLRYELLSEEFKTPENLLRIRTYYRNLVNTLVIGPDGVVVMKKTGNPSGSCNTITDNTLILYTLLAYAWIITSSSDLRSYESFELHTAKALVGDDNTWTVSDEAHVFYNAKSVIEQWRLIGVTTTTDSLEPRKPEDLDFLSARTVFLSGKAVPIYNRTKLMTSLLYAPREHLTPAITLERTAAMLSVGWTDLPFRRFCREVIDWLMEKYDEVLNDEPRWIMAKCQIQSDETYFRLFTGEKMPLHRQSLSGSTVKLTQPDKNTMNRVTPKRNGTKPGKKTTKSNRSRKPVGAAQRRPAISQKRTRKRAGRRVMSPGGIGSPRTDVRSRKTCVVEEDEFIGAVNGSVGFAVTSYALNPGQVGTFPWLSVQAAQWEKYRFDYLEFYYKREVSEFATNGTTGKVILGVDFDASDPAPSSKQQIEDSDPRVDGMPCENLRLPLSGKQLHPLTPVSYVRSGGLPGSSDIKTYDVGNFNIATQGCQNTSEIGELRVRYRVSFSIPILDSATAVPRNNSVFAGRVSVGQSCPSGVGELLVFVTEANGLGAVNTAGSIVLPPGNYLAWIQGNANFSGTATQFYVDIRKNGTSISGISKSQWSSGSIGDVENADTAFFTSNGTDAITVQVTLTFSTGTGSATGTLLILAV